MELGFLERVPNSLAFATSPYLQQHASNPVDWMEWGGEAFACAKERDKPIFLSIGFSTCKGCEQMARESFSDEAIAGLLNQNFVSIKLDRDERPDIDRVYMTYVQAVTGKRVWPLTVWLTPDLMPFFGGSYFPPEDRDPAPGFRRVLNSIAEGWKDDRAKVVAEASRVVAKLAENIETAPVGESEPDLTEAGGEAFESAYTYFFENFDEQYGGFGGAPKFPRSINLEFLMRCAALQGGSSESGREALGMVQGSLVGMAKGGIHDVVDGGFHQYAVDDEWRMPSFDKMLFDQGQITSVLIGFSEFSDDPRYAAIAREVLGYVSRELKHPAGGFYAAERVDPSEGVERQGALPHPYLWTEAELRETLEDDFSWFAELYGIQAEGNVPPKYDAGERMLGLNVLHQIQPLDVVARSHSMELANLAELLGQALSKLRTKPSSKRRRLRDDKIVTSWNGWMIGAFARAATLEPCYSSSERSEYLKSAELAAEFVRVHLWDQETGTLRHVWRDGRATGPGFAADYANIISGLLELYEARFDHRWLRWADELQTSMDAQFWDRRGGGYFNTSVKDESVILRLKDDRDSAEPSANSVAAANLFRLSALLSDESHRKRGYQIIQSVRPIWAKTPWVMPGLLMAMEWALSSERCVTFYGDISDSNYGALLSVARDRRGARRVVRWIGGEGMNDWLESRLPADFPRTESGFGAIVSSRTGCSDLVNTALDLGKLLLA